MRRDIARRMGDSGKKITFDVMGEAVMLAIQMEPSLGELTGETVTVDKDGHAVFPVDAGGYEMYARA